MEFRVIARADNFQIFNTVIVSVPVDMMNNLVWKQRATYKLFHYRSVKWNIYAPYSFLDVLRFVLTSWLCWAWVSLRYIALTLPALSPQSVLVARRFVEHYIRQNVVTLCTHFHGFLHKRSTPTLWRLLRSHRRIGVHEKQNRQPIMTSTEWIITHA